MNIFAKTIAAALLVWPILSAGGAPAADAPAAMQEVPLGNGTVTVLARGPVTLHAWNTGDALGDHCFLLETKEGLVAIESPAFKADVERWKGYAESLGKPLTDILLSAHPTGGRWFGEAQSHATAAAANAIGEGATGALAASLGKAFGEAFSADIPAIDATLAAGENSVGALTLTVIEAGDGYDVLIPAAGLCYTHMLGADSHSILASQGHMDAVLAELKTLRDSGCDIILSAHHTMERPADIDTKMAYVRRVQEIAAAAKDRAAFTRAMHDTFPGLAGESYLEMSAGMLFAE